MEEYFNKNLSHFIKDFACKGEVIAKYKNKKPISKIARELSFPISEESVIQILWEYLIDNNIVLLYDVDSKENEQVDYEKKVDAVGKVHFEAVKRKKIQKDKYVLIDIVSLRCGIDKLNSMCDFEREMIEKLPFENRSYYIKKEWV